MSARLKVNCDLGEGFPHDPKIMPLIDQANIACGYHAGDHTTMSTSVHLAKHNNVEIGAHPSYFDPSSFGRKSFDLTESEIVNLVAYQVGALHGITLAHAYTLGYIKPHGALYNDMMKCDKTLTALCHVSSKFNLPLMILAKTDNSREIQIAKKYKVKLIYEAFADRRYDIHGQLTPRSDANATISDIRSVLTQVQTLEQQGYVETLEGDRISIQADTVCIHGDNPGSDKVAKAIRNLLT